MSPSSLKQLVSRRQNIRRANFHRTVNKNILRIKRKLKRGGF